jgi:hypothetical protein
MALHSALPSNPQPTNNAITATQAHDAVVKNWAKRLYEAIKDGKTYEARHDQFFKEFDELRDAAKVSGSTKVSMLNHVAPIYNHLASQGYQPGIHFAPLQQAVYNYCQSKPVADWTGPPDQWSRSPSPTVTLQTPNVINPPPPTKSTETLNATDAAPLQKSKATNPRPVSEATNPPPASKKPQAPKSSDVPKIPRMTVTKTVFGTNTEKASEQSVQSDNEDSEEEANVKPGRQRKSLPSTHGLSLHMNKCYRCDKYGHRCHVNPKTMSIPLSSCFECNFWKTSCSATGRMTKRERDLAAFADDHEDNTTALDAGKAPLDIVQERASLKGGEKEQPTGRARPTRRKPTPVAAGEPGQYGGKFFFSLFFTST